MNFKTIDGVKNKMKPTPSKRTIQTIRTSINYYNICFLKYLKDLIIANNIGGGLNE